MEPMALCPVAHELELVHIGGAKSRHSVKLLSLLTTTATS